LSRQALPAKLQVVVAGLAQLAFEPATQVVAHIVPLAQPRPPPQGCVAPATQLPDPSHVLAVNIPAEQVDAHAVPAAG
jgi:hypothetical protein